MNNERQTNEQTNKQEKSANEPLRFYFHFTLYNHDDDDDDDDDG